MSGTDTKPWPWVARWSTAAAFMSSYHPATTSRLVRRHDRGPAGEHGPDAGVVVALEAAQLAELLDEPCRTGSLDSASWTNTRSSRRPSQRSMTQSWPKRGTTRSPTVSSVMPTSREDASRLLAWTTNASRSRTYSSSDRAARSARTVRSSSAPVRRGSWDGSATGVKRISRSGPPRGRTAGFGVGTAWARTAHRMGSPSRPRRGTLPSQWPSVRIRASSSRAAGGTSRRPW